jgi:tetratricopeptide (TPR) repeat protein
MKPTIISAMLLALWGASAIDARAQAMVRGSVVDEDGNPVPDVDIEIQYKGKDPKTFDRKTNDKGGYVQVGMPSGNYVLVFTKEGYNSATIQSWLPDGLSELEQVTLTALQVVIEEAPEAAPDAAGEIQETFAKALEATQAGDVAQGEALYKQVLEIAPDLAEARFNLGHVYRMQERWEEAEAEFKRVLELQPERSDSYSALAAIYNETGKTEDAVAILARSAEQFPDDALFQFNLGVTFLNAGESDHAITAFQRALELEPSRIEAHFRLAQLLLGTGDLQGAISHLETYRAGTGQNPENLAMSEEWLATLKQAVQEQQ